MSLEREFTEAISQARGIIFRVIRLYVNDPEDEKDLYQEILYQAWRSYPRFKADSKFSTWLYRVALNTVLTFKRKPVKPTTPLVDSVATNATSQSVQANEQVEALYQAIRSLGAVDRMIITMHLDGYDNEEIAEVAGLKKNHVGVKLFRIKEVLGRKLG